MKYVIRTEVPDTDSRRYYVKKGIWSQELFRAVLFDNRHEAQQLIDSLDSRIIPLRYRDTLRVVALDEANMIHIMDQ